MKTSSVSFVAILLLVTAASAASAITIDDFYVHYRFDETSGTSFVDSGPNATAADFYRAYKFNELPSIDVSHVTVNDLGAPLANIGDFQYLGIGKRLISDVEHDMLVDIPTHASLPGAGDSFAVSFWLTSAGWNAYGLDAAYNVNGLEWSIGTSGSNMIVWSKDGEASGDYNWVTSLSGLTAGGFAHFVAQFEGSSGVTALYINGVASTDTTANTSYFWGNEQEGFTLGGRVLDARNYSVPNQATSMDDFAIIDGVVDQADVNNLMTNGASSLGARRLAHYAMNDLTGTQITDSSANANHGTLVGYDPLTMGLDNRDLAPASRPGVHGNAVAIASGFTEHAKMASADGMPVGGDDFTVCFWLKPDEILANAIPGTAYAGWDNSGMIFSWSNDNLGFSIGQYNQLDGAIIARRTTGDYTSTDNQDLYGIYLGAGNTTTPGLQLDPTVWHHFAVTVDVDGNITGMYVDGNYVASQYENGHGITDEETGIAGARIKNGALDLALNADLDDLGVVSGQLTEAQIQLAMNHGLEALLNPPPQIPGDTNGDNKVDEADAKELATNWGAPVTAGDVTKGDFNGDGIVNAMDAAILAANWGDYTGVEATGTAVPEPGVLGLLFAALLTMAGLRRRG